MKTSVLVVLVTSNGLGAVVKGITGFGSAIINLCVWIVATCAGINSGTLQQAVLTECICSEVVAIPLLFLTKAHATCDWALVLSLSIFGAVGAPVGAAMLKHLPPRQVEFAVGCLMLLVILLNLWRKARANKGTHQQAAGSLKGCEAQPGTVTPEETADKSATEAAVCCSSVCHNLNNSIELPELPLVIAGQVDNMCLDKKQHSTAGMSADVMPAAATVRVLAHSSSSSSQHSDCCADAHCICVIPSLQQQQQQQQGFCWEDAEDAALLPSVGGLARQQSSEPHRRSITSDPCPRSLTAANCSATQPQAGLKQRLQAWWGAAMQPERLAAFRRMLLMGSLAGSASGVMAGLTGMGGPPVMLMFEKLQVPKDTVRGTNAVCNVIQVRIFVYLAMGVFSRADLPLYIASSLAAVVGMLVGCSLAGRTNQATFSHMLTVLMVLCCALMFASAAGVAGSSESHTSR